MSGLRYEAWTLPWQGDFKRKIARLPAITDTGSGSKQLFSTGGSGSVDLALGSWSRLDELISDTEGSLVRVYDQYDVIDEWIAKRTSRQHSDNNKVAGVSGDALVSVLDKYVIMPYDSLNPTIQGDWKWGNGGDEDSGLLANGGFEKVPFANGGLELGLSSPWEPTQTEGIFKSAGIVATDDPVNAFAGDWYLSAIPTTADSGATVTIGGLVFGKQYTLTGKVKESTAAGKRIRAGVSDASSASHTNAYTSDGYWWAELDNVASGAGSSNGTWQTITLTFVAAAESVKLAIVFAGTGSLLDFWVDGWIISGFGVGLDPWGPRYQVNTFEYDTTVKHSGLASVKVQGSDQIYTNPYTGESRFGTLGILQKVGVTPGRIYTATWWVRQDSGVAQTFVFVLKRVAIRGRIGTPGSSHMRDHVQAIPSGVWTRVQLTTLSDTSEITFELRWQYQGAIDTLLHPSPTFWVDDCSLFEGFPATTPGDITNKIFDRLVAEGLFDWVDYSTITVVNDSGATPWPDEIGLTIQWGQSIGQLLDQFVDLGYEWDFVPKATPIGLLTHDLFLYVSGGRDSAPATAINVKQGIISGEVVKRIPEYTRVVMEGADGAYSEVTDATTDANFGPLKTFQANRELGDALTRTLAANQLLAFEAANRNAVQVEIFRADGFPIPLVTYRPGDTVPMQIPPTLAKASRRVQRVDYTNSFPPKYSVVGSRLLDGEAAAYDLIWRMWRRFQRPKQQEKAAVSGEGEKGGAFTIQIAAADGPQIEKDKADLIATGVNDHRLIQSMIDANASSGFYDGLHVVLGSGTFQFDWDAEGVSSLISTNASVVIEGQGSHTTLIKISGSGANGQIAFDLGGEGSGIRDLRIEDNSTGSGFNIVIVLSGSYNSITNVSGWTGLNGVFALLASSVCHVDFLDVDYAQTGIEISIGLDGYATIDNCNLVTEYRGVFINGTNKVTVADCHIISDTLGITVGSSDYVRLTGNDIEVTGTGGAGHCIDFIGAGDYTTITGNTLKTHSVGNAIHVAASCRWITITGNSIESLDGYGIYLISGNVYNVSITGNTFPEATSGAVYGNGAWNVSIVGNTLVNSSYINANPCFYFEKTGTGGTGLIIANNLLEFSHGSGVSVDGYTQVSVMGNNFYYMDRHGVIFNNVTDSAIIGNIFKTVGAVTANTYDIIQLSGNSDNNDIWNNKGVDNTESQPRYFINISASTCDNNSYLGNRSGPAAGYGTGAYNDAGTGTINTWPGAASPQGDNLL